MVRRIRNNWAVLGRIIWRTKTIIICLLMNLILFSCIGYFLFKESDYFSSFFQSLLQLYILLSTCNFPDIMLDTFKVSKWAIVYFVIYISINIFIILSYLKTLYFTRYFQINKEDCLEIKNNIIDNKFNKDYFQNPKFREFILEQKDKYSLNDFEYSNILTLLNIDDKNNRLFDNLTNKVEKLQEKENYNNSTYGKLILESFLFELIINILCFLLLILSIVKYTFILAFQFAFCFFVFFEFVILTKVLGIKKFCLNHINRISFHVFNLAIFIIIIYLLFINEGDDSPKYQLLYQILQIFLSLRTIRIFVFLYKFEVIKNIYVILRNSKEMFYRNLFTLYSFFLIFSTFSILLTGGNIEKDSFDDKVESIPEYYIYANFNDFSSSYISCFSLLMINNLNILVKSLTYHIENNKIIFQFYFATFHFLSTLMIINIIQTSLLELYLNSKYWIEHKKIKDNSNENENISQEEVIKSENTSH
jgi:hypothetical protein